MTFQNARQEKRRKVRHCGAIDRKRSWLREHCVANTLSTANRSLAQKYPLQLRLLLHEIIEDNFQIPQLRKYIVPMLSVIIYDRLQFFGCNHLDFKIGNRTRYVRTQKNRLQNGRTEVEDSVQRELLALPAPLRTGATKHLCRYMISVVLGNTYRQRFRIGSSFMNTVMRAVIIYGCYGAVG